MKHKRWLGALLLLTLCLAGGALAAAPRYQVAWGVFSGGGGYASSANWGAAGSAGQAAVGTARSASFGAISGYWQDFAERFAVYLPLVVRDFGP